MGQRSQRLCKYWVVYVKCEHENPFRLGKRYVKIRIAYSYVNVNM